jgi:chromate transporter
MPSTPPEPEEGPVGSAPAPIVPFSDAFWFWLKLGFVGFGGPAGQIAIMHQELVEKRRWISERRFLHAWSASSPTSSVFRLSRAVVQV